jgi:hypothetical protein
MALKDLIQVLDLHNSLDLRVKLIRL